MCCGSWWGSHCSQGPGLLEDHAIGLKRANGGFVDAGPRKAKGMAWTSRVALPRARHPAVTTTVGDAGAGVGSGKWLAAVTDSERRARVVGSFAMAATRSLFDALQGRRVEVEAVAGEPGC